MITIMFAFWVFRVRIGYVEFNSLLLLWVFFPVAAFGMGFLFRRRPFWKLIFAFSVLYCVVYALYCLPGEAGNNLPLLFVPPSLFLFSFILVPLMVIIGGWLTEAWMLFISRINGNTKKEGSEKNL